MRHSFFNDINFIILIMLFLMFAPTAALLLVLSQFLFYIRFGLEGAFDPTFVRMSFLLCSVLGTIIITEFIIGGIVISFMYKNRPIIKSAPSIFNFPGSRHNSIENTEEFIPLKPHEVVKKIETYGEEQ